MIPSRQAPLTARARRARVDAYLLRRRARVMPTHADDQALLGAAQRPARVQDVARRIDDFGDCTVCGAPVLFHFAGPGVSGRFLGHRAAGERALVERVKARQRGAQQSVAVISHAAQSGEARGVAPAKGLR